MDWVKIVVIILAIAKVIDWIVAFKKHSNCSGIKKIEDNF